MSEPFRLGPARRYLPVCVRYWHGFLGGPAGYCRSDEGDGPIVVEHETAEPLGSDSNGRLDD